MSVPDLLGSTPVGRGPAAVEGLETSEVTDGLVVYDEAKDRVHYLNPTAAFIFTLADGTKSVVEMAELMGSAFGLDRPPVAETEGCVAQLRDEGLIR